MEEEGKWEKERSIQESNEIKARKVRKKMVVCFLRAGQVVKNCMFCFDFKKLDLHLS